MAKVTICVLALAVLGAALVSGQVAKQCVNKDCKLWEGCICSSPYSPLDTKDTPQFVLITFDESVNSNSLDTYYKPLLFGRTNGGGSGIPSTEEPVPTTTPDGSAETTPEVEVTTPAVEVTTPEVEVTTPEVEVTTPEVEITSTSEGRARVDQTPISATFYVPHEYTEYDVVNELYNAGFEVASHSISKGSADYWANADAATLFAEFDGQRAILERFAGVPRDDVVGVKTPHHQLKGDETFAAYRDAGYRYDGSWTSLSTLPLFPYTLHYASQQSCLIGTCPHDAYPELAVLPINNNRDVDGVECNSMFACRTNGTVAETRDWLLGLFRERYEGARGPLVLPLSSAWFQLYPDTFPAMQQFLDAILAYDDVFVVSHRQLLDWALAPQPIGEYAPAPTHAGPAACEPMVCPLRFGEDETRYMRNCVAPCPAVYPWVNNPLGEAE